jgi:hypothetical protein
MKTVAAALALALTLACGGKPKPTEAPANKDVAPPPANKVDEGTGVAKVTERKQTGGVIELGGDRAKAMEDASKQMDAHCGQGNYTITQEGEEAVAGGQNTVWRVHYSCN